MICMAIDLATIQMAVDLPMNQENTRGKGGYRNYG